MLALIFLLLILCAGFITVKTFIPGVLDIHGNGALFADQPRRLFPRFLVVLPASFSVGAIFSGWTVYLFAYAFRETGRAMFYGTLAAFIILTGLILLYFAVTNGGLRKLARNLDFAALPRSLTTDLTAADRPLLIFFACTAAFVIWLMSYTFFVSGNTIYSGYTVFSDFAVHTALIRSFSLGNNFPTQFPHFPDGTIRYHFLFQFLTGALEYLGLRIDWAFNSLSVLALLSCAALLYVLAVWLTGRSAVGMLTVLFLFFRSSFSGIIYIYENGPYPNLNAVFDLILGTDFYIGRTTNEDWGLWTANVYINQRHFALGISVLLLVVMAMLPHMKKMLDSIPKKAVAEWIFSPDAWLGENYPRAVFLGVLTGGLAFFNGATAIALLSILAVCAIFSKHRLEFLIIAVLAWMLSSMEASFFASGTDVVKPQFFFGFIASDKSLKGVASYIFELSGAAPFLTLLAIILNFRHYLGVYLMFMAPFAVTFCLSLTPDINVNHKYLMISAALLNILCAYGLVALYDFQPKKLSFKWSRRLCKGLAGLLLVILLSTGIIDNITLHNGNGKNKSYQAPLTSAFHTWLLENTEPGDVFASAWHTIHPVFLAGRFEYMGWPYYAWSAGYDTNGRTAILRAMLESDDPDELRRLARENRISYILIDPGLLREQEFTVNEANIQAAYPLAYTDESAGVRVYQTDYAH
ncbi:MAG: hypothetical protein LBL26_12195 [Peptococcaceae bacterium]|nr:hypothetical protein [Peptococcaceae bacterium]